MKRHILKYARHGNGPTQYRHNPATVMKLVHKLIILSFNSYHFTFYNSGEKVTNLIYPRSAMPFYDGEPRNVCHHRIGIWSSIVGFSLRCQMLYAS